MRRLERPLVIAVITLAMVQGFGVFVELTEEYETAINRVLRLAFVIAIAVYVAAIQFRLRDAKAREEFHKACWNTVPFGICFYNLQANIEYHNTEFTRLMSSGLLQKGFDNRILEVITTGTISEIQYLLVHEGKDKELLSQIIPIKQKDTVIAAIHIMRECTSEWEALTQQEEGYIQVITMLVNLFELKDPFGQGHSQTVSNLARDLARSSNLSANEVECISMAALFHDIGKFMLAKEFVSNQDFETIREHAGLGAAVVQLIPVIQHTADLICHHHERFDGRGYPDQLKGEAIPLGARIIAIADAFDTMTAGRTALGKSDVDDALRILELEMGRQFDPELVDTFAAMIRRGRIGIVDH